MESQKFEERIIEEVLDNLEAINPELVADDSEEMNSLIERICLKYQSIENLIGCDHECDFEALIPELDDDDWDCISDWKLSEGRKVYNLWKDEQIRVILEMLSNRQEEINDSIDKFKLMVNILKCIQ